MAALRRRLLGLQRLAWRDRLLLAEVFVGLGLARLAIKIVPMRRLAGWFGARQAETPPTVPPADLHAAQRIAWAMRTVSPHTPWRSNCYPQAFAAKLLLRRRNIASTLYLGATKEAGAAEFAAHAWLRCGPLYVTGGRGEDTYAVLASFGA